MDYPLAAYVAITVVWLGFMWWLAHQCYGDPTVSPFKGLVDMCRSLKRSAKKARSSKRRK